MANYRALFYVVYLEMVQLFSAAIVERCRLSVIHNDCNRH